MSLRLCSLAARGLWMEMLSIMGISEKIGYLQIGGKAITVDQVSVMAGINREEAEKYIAELESNSVFSRDENGVIYNRRMAREAEGYEKAREYGKRGGNPLLVSESISKNPEARIQKLEAREGITPPVKGRVKGEEYTADFEEFWKAYPKKKEKQYAFKAFLKAIKKTDIEKIMSAVKEQKKTKEWIEEDGKYIKHPSTWLNKGCWDDKLTVDKEKGFGYRG
jgi:hypothetical protein